MSIVPLEIAHKSNDTGYADTISVLIDSFKLAGKSRRYEDILIPTKSGLIYKRKLIIPLKVTNLIDGILAVDFERKQKKIKVKDGEEVQVYYINTTYKDFPIYYDPRKRHFNIMVQHLSLLGKAEEEIINDIRGIFQNYFGLSDEYLNNLKKAVKLSRIDFKRDYRYKDEQHLSLIKFIVEIATDSIVRNNYQKLDEKDEHPEIEDFDDIEYMKKYKSPSNKTAEFVIYDKQLEQESKFRQGKITQDELDYYERVLRFEVRIKNRKLNSSKKKDGISKNIDNYKDENVADELFSQYAELVFFKEPFYRLDVAKRIIRNKDLSEVSQYKKDTFRKLLNAINEKGFTRAKQEYEYPSMFNSHIAELRSLNINPLTFNETWTDKDGNIHKTTYTTIPNFIQKENCLEEEGIIPSKLQKLMEQVENT